MNEKLVKEITSRDVDFAKWYTDIVTKADLIDYTSVKGCMIFRPYGYAIWENIQKVLDKKFKQTGHQNVYMPLLIPESLLNKEKDHVEGFAPEVAWVTHGGMEKLPERLCIRPTSETLFCEHYANTVKSYRDLPKLYNQWCSVVRWEKTTRPFLRNREFLWQEGHTIHETSDEAQRETLRMLNIYGDFAEEFLALPVIRGRKTEKEKFAGAVATYTIEAMMYNGVALQAGTSHYFGDGFAKAFGITYLDKENKTKYVHQTSWGISTRTIGGIIMCHGDDHGLVLPPKIAPIQVVIIPIGNNDEVKKRAYDLNEMLNNSFITSNVDDRDKSPGYRFAESEMKGIPVRIELGPRDLEKNICVFVRRDTLEKKEVLLENVLPEIQKLLEDIQDNMYQSAKSRRNSMIYDAVTMDEMVKKINNGGFVRALWCGDRACEEKIKKDYGITSRCIPLEKIEKEGNCICCGKHTDLTIYWGKQY